MKKAKSADVLTNPEIQRHTERILALREEERQTRVKLGSIIAAIGAELIAVKEALDRSADKTAWLRWLKVHVHYSADTAQNYMRVARFAEKNRNVSVFFEMDPSVLYRIAALPGGIAATLTPDTLLEHYCVLLRHAPPPGHPVTLLGFGSAAPQHAGRE